MRNFLVVMQPINQYPSPLIPQMITIIIYIENNYKVGNDNHYHVNNHSQVGIVILNSLIIIIKVGVRMIFICNNPITYLPLITCLYVISK